MKKRTNIGLTCIHRREIHLFAQSVSSYSATEAGIILLPATIVMIVFNFVGSLMALKIGIRKVLIL